MTSKERMERAVTFNRPDRPPLDVPAMAPGIAVYMKELQLPSLQAVSDFFGSDTIRLEPDYIGPQPFPDWGMTFGKDDQGNKLQTGYPCAKMSADEIRRLPCPPATSADWYDYKGYAKKCAAHPDKVILTTTGHSIYNWATALLAPQDEALMMFYSDPDRLHAALDRMTDFHAEFVTRLLQADPHVPEYVFFNDDVCTQRGPFFSPEMFDEFVAPRFKRITDIVHKHNRRYMQHCCGSVRKLLPNFIRAGVDIIQPIQPGVEGNDLNEIRKEFGKQVVLFRGMDMQNFMRLGKPQDITDHYRRMADDFKDGGLIFNVWCQTDIPLKNMLALRKAFFD
jgi:uroporphyrinogen decarboxylase